MTFVQSNRVRVRPSNRVAAACAACSTVLLLGALSRAQDAKPASEPGRVEFELLRSLHIAVPVKINDAGPYRLIFDLGAPINLVSGRFAVEAGLITKEVAERPAFFGMRGEKVVKKLQVGEVVAENIPVMVMDHPTIKAISEVLGPIDGIIGYPFFARYKFAIDYPAKTMTFTPSDYKPQNVMSQMIGRMFGNRDAKKKRIAPAGLWGFDCDRPASDESAGVVIIRVWPGSPAANAGLQENDRILTFADRWTDSSTELAEAAALATPGEPMTIEVARGDTTLKIEVTPVLGL
jgi:membrane-associated protease RseP (regulator of RpoE activity)